MSVELYGRDDGAHAPLEMPPISDSLPIDDEVSADSASSISARSALSEPELLSEPPSDARLTHLGPNSPSTIIAATF